MKNNAYYKPHISEFYFGFEYEFCSVSKVKNEETGKDEHIEEWLPRVVGEGVWDLQKQIKPFITSNRIRVKCLDNEDITSLGWQALDVQTDSPRFLWKDEGRILTLRHEYALRMIYIFDDEVGVGYYCGKCHNKSQLKDIMKNLELIQKKYVVV